MKKHTNQPLSRSAPFLSPSPLSKATQAIGPRAAGGGQAGPRSPKLATMRQAEGRQKQESFKKFAASELFCAKCQRAQPVREKQLLYLPDGDLFDYRCAVCGSVVGTRRT